MTATELPDAWRSDRPEPVGIVHDGFVEADNLTTADPEFLATAAELDGSQEIGELCQEVFELGVAVRRMAEVDAETRRLGEQLSTFEASIDDLTRQATSTLRTEVESVLDPAQGSLSVATREGSAALSAAVSSALDMTDRESAASTLVDAVAENSSAAIRWALADVQRLLDASSDSSPLAAMRREIVQAVTEPMRHVSEQITAVHSVTVDRQSRATTPRMGWSSRTSWASC